MIRYPVSALGQYGILQDRKPHELPLNAWSAGNNVRFREDFVEKFQGHVEIFDPPSVAPYYLLPVVYGSNYYWLYAGLAKVYAWNGSSHTNITRQTTGVDVDYNATADKNWVSCVLGGIPILNNGVDSPQAWSPPTVATKLAELANWPANTICGSLRAFKSFLVALDVTKSGTRYPHMVKWSHPAPLGAVPASWDETDPTKDAGEWELKETNGAILDCLPLGDMNIIYKEDATHLMQFIGGTEIFKFSMLFETIGALSRRCAALVKPGVHTVLTKDDIILHSGTEQSVSSLIESRVRRALFKDMSTSAAIRSFITVVRPRKEVWYCYCTPDASIPNKALVWNMVSNTFTFRDLPNAAHIASGVAYGGSEAWNSAVGNWDSDTTVWSEAAFGTTFLRSLIAGAVNTKLFMADEGSNFNGTNMTATVERTGIGYPLKDGGPPDFAFRKFMTRLWPRIEGTLGGVVNVYVGSQDKVDGPVTYGSAMPFTIGDTVCLEPMVNAPLHALKFESTGDIEWRLHGYDVEVRQAGRSW